MRSGVSLLEVLVAAGLSLLLLTTAVQIFIPSLKASDRGTRRVELDQRAWTLSTRLERRLLQSSRAGIAVHSLTGETLVSAHPRHSDSAQVTWADTLDLFVWSGETFRAYQYNLGAVSDRPRVPSLSELRNLLDQATLIYEFREIEDFQGALDSGPLFRFSVTAQSGNERLTVHRSLFLRNSSH